jgi:hypothetical protein
METLPVITNIIKTFDDDMCKSYVYNIPNEYDDFIQLFKDMISSDCWALVVDEQIIFNSYQNKSLRNKLLDKVVRNHIIDNPHSLLCELFVNKKDAKIVVYMFGQNSWFMVTNFSYENNTFDVKYYDTV